MLSAVWRTHHWEQRTIVLIWCVWWQCHSLIGVPASGRQPLWRVTSTPPKSSSLSLLPPPTLHLSSGSSPRNTARCCIFSCLRGGTQPPSNPSSWPRWPLFRRLSQSSLCREYRLLGLWCCWCLRWAVLLFRGFTSESRSRMCILCWFYFSSSLIIILYTNYTSNINWE